MVTDSENPNSFGIRVRCETRSRINIRHLTLYGFFIKPRTPIRRVFHAAAMPHGVFEPPIKGGEFQNNMKGGLLMNDIFVVMEHSEEISIALRGFSSMDGAVKFMKSIIEENHGMMTGKNSGVFEMTNEDWGTIQYSLSIQRIPFDKF